MNTMADNSDAIKREMFRASLDNIRVYNPTSQDFTIVWDKFKHTVPNRDKDVGFGKGQKVMLRYLAEKWCRDMKNKILGEEAEIMVQDIIDRSTPDMKEKYLSDPYERQKLYDRAPNINDAKAVKRVYEIIWLGVEERYGMDETEGGTPQLQDQRPVEEQILENMNKPAKKRVDPVEPLAEVVTLNQTVPPEIKDSFPIWKKRKDRLIEEVKA